VFFILEHCMQQYIEDTNQITVYKIKIKINVDMYMQAYITKTKSVLSKFQHNCWLKRQLQSQLQRNYYYMYMCSKHFCLFIYNYTVEPEGLITQTQKPTTKQINYFRNNISQNHITDFSGGGGKKKLFEWFVTVIGTSDYNNTKYQLSESAESANLFHWIVNLSYEIFS
jgi:hypothetical protein